MHVPAMLCRRVRRSGPSTTSVRPPSRQRAAPPTATAVALHTLPVRLRRRTVRSVRRTMSCFRDSGICCTGQSRESAGQCLFCPFRDCFLFHVRFDMRAAAASLSGTVPALDASFGDVPVLPASSCTGIFCGSKDFHQGFFIGRKPLQGLFEVLHLRLPEQNFLLVVGEFVLPVIYLYRAGAPAAGMRNRRVVGYHGRAEVEKRRSARRNTVRNG